MAETIDFAVSALNSMGDNDHDVNGPPKKVDSPVNGIDGQVEKANVAPKGMEQIAVSDERILSGLRILGKAAPSSNLADFEGTPIDGLLPRLARGELGLKAA